MKTHAALPGSIRPSTGRDREAAHARTALSAAGAWLAVASLLMIVVLGLHGPISPDLSEQMRRIAAAPTRWTVAHWLAAASLSFYALTGLLVLTSRSRLTTSGWTLSAWGVVSVGALWTLTTALTEATVVTGAALSASPETFEAWWALAEAHANGFAFLALAVAVIAWEEARSQRGATPVWAARIGMVAAVGSFSGWTLGMWLALPAGSLLWVASSALMSLWTLWFGVALLRQDVAPA